MEVFLYYTGIASIVLITIASLMVATFLYSLYLNDGSGTITIGKKHPLYYMMIVLAIPTVTLKKLDVLSGELLNPSDMRITYSIGINEWIRKNKNLCAFFWRTMIFGTLMIPVSVSIVLIFIFIAIFLFIAAHIVTAILISLKMISSFFIKLYQWIKNKILGSNIDRFIQLLDSIDTSQFKEGKMTITEYFKFLIKEQPDFAMSLLALKSSSKNDIETVNLIFSKLISAIKSDIVSSSDDIINTYYIGDFYIDRYDYDGYNKKIIRCINRLHRFIYGWEYINKTISESVFRTVISSDIHPDFFVLHKKSKQLLLKQINMHINNCKYVIDANKNIEENDNNKPGRMAIIKGFYQKTLCPEIIFEKQTY